MGYLEDSRTPLQSLTDSINWLDGEIVHAKNERDKYHARLVSIDAALESLELQRADYQRAVDILEDTIDAD